MNILYIEQSINPCLGGIEKVTNIISTELEKYGHNCFFLFNKEDYDKVPDQKKIKISYKEEYNTLYNKINDFTKRNKINVIIFQDISHKYIYRIFKQIKNEHKSIQLIYCFHVSPDYWKFFKFKWDINNLKQIIKKCLGINPYIRSIQNMYALVDKFVLLSESFFSDFQYIYKIKDTSKLKAISNPLAFPEELIIPHKKENTILIVSRFCERQKNLKAALRIWKKIEKENDSWRLQIVGYGEDEKEIRTYAEKLNLKNISFEGKQNNVFPFYAKAKIFMMTSLFEGFGMTLIEAQQAGCVPIAFDNFSVLHDIITNEQNGFIIPDNNEEAYVHCCLSLINNPELLRILSNNAQKDCMKFSTKHICKKWIDLISQKNSKK